MLEKFLDVLIRIAVALEALAATAGGAVTPKETAEAEPPARRRRAAAKDEGDEEKADPPARRRRAATKDEGDEKGDAPSVEDLKERAAKLASDDDIGGDKVRELTAKCGAAKISGLTEAGRAKLGKLFAELEDGEEGEEGDY